MSLPTSTDDGLTNAAEEALQGESGALQAGQAKRSPLDAWHRSAGAKMVPFAGYDMPIQYDGIVSEHQSCRTRAAVFDVSHMGRLRFDGDQAAEFLDHALTRRVSDLRVGSVRYAMVCREDGGVLDDVLVSQLETPSSQRYHLLVVNASNRDKILHHLGDLMSDFPRVTMSDRTDLTAMIAVQGPLAVAICKRLLDFDPSRLKNYQARITEQMSKPVIVSRTGYTGEDGLELIVRQDHAHRVWENVLLAGREAGIAPAGLGARDTLRMEAAMPLYGHELNETIDPISAGLSFACDLENREFIGRDAIQKAHQDGTPRRRIGLSIKGKRPAREGCHVVDSSGSVVGTITSGGPSPTLGNPIAMAMVDSECLSHPNGQIGGILQVDIRGRLTDAVVTRLPFYRRSQS
ncbi:MAG: glycine cleavage system aminomethyltransferase GcvT [Planctomycetota bacterium]